MPAKGSLKGLGQKYGGSLRKRYSRVYRQLKAKRACPRCSSLKFKRVAIGIWNCSSCNYKVADGAYDATV
ncbi:MAG: 50S ribosomal protein L37 [Thaumarchaeota archaeon]|nr:50S ribosomal protein L37 [Nitrososphaerota archaeon]